MIFVDKVQVKVKAGDGGDGKLSFRHAIYAAKGGPDGGDGGDGGNVILVASRNQNTLTAFRYQKELKAESGFSGGQNKKHGKNGKDLIVPVPVGTVVTNLQGKTLVDLVSDGGSEIIAKAGKGGFGNAHFVSSKRQAPNFAEKGEPGEIFDLVFELKMIADVGLIGLPNAGKSTLLSKISNARPSIADYPFTTLTPNLGVVDIDKSSSVMFADIPGLIEGAAEGKGLGHDFLRHIERTSVLLHLIDAYNKDIKKSYLSLRNELKAYQSNLIKRPEIIAITKVEGLDNDMISDLINQLKDVAAKKTAIYAISAHSGQGLKELLYFVRDEVNKEKVKSAKLKKIPLIPILRLPDNTIKWNIKKKNGLIIISGKNIERFANRTNFDNDQAIIRFRDIMRRQGITAELIKKGIKADQKIQIGENDNNCFIF